MLRKLKLITIVLPLLITACGGDSDKPPTEKEEVIIPNISIETLVDIAIENNTQVAKFQVTRDSGSEVLLIGYLLSGSEDETLGSASSNDYQLKYADGSDVGDSITIKANNNSRIIELVPIKDEFNEVAETLNLSLQTSSKYILADSKAQAKIIDAQDNAQNRKVFYGTFGQQGDALTSASGVLSFILSGDNSYGLLNYSFSNLTSEQTDQHIHMAPSGQSIKDIEIKGNLQNWLWELAPGGIYKTKQDMLDALFAGVFFVNIHTANYSHGEISAPLKYDETISPPEIQPLTATDVDRDIIRFLNQATFGATPKTYQTLRAQISTNGDNRLQIYNQWIDEQISIEPNSMLEFTEAVLEHFPEEASSSVRRDTFWNLAVHGKDQLRQRMASALSQILVISDESATIRKAHKGAALYWDMLASQAFGNYNKLLKDVSLTPIMGHWLSHLRNQKQDVEKGYFPDENYAREIMQLFSFGLVHRNQNGTIILGEDNLPMPTYDNETIKNLARIFTGLSFSYKLKDGIKQENYWFLTYDNVNNSQYRWVEPMKFFPDFHDFESKTLFTDHQSTIVLPENSEQTAETAMLEFEKAINAIVAHQSTAPFISRQLIQRLVTSNPSPEYIARVASKFNLQGDLTAVVKAILLDPEARNPNALKSSTFGKIKEPILQMTAILRLFEAASQVPLGTQNNGLNIDINEGFESQASLLRLGDINLGQRTLGAESVFNFYSPNYAPTGELSSHSLVSPELQLFTESQLYSIINQFYKLVYSGLVRGNSNKYSVNTKAQLTVQLQYNNLNTLWSNTSGNNKEKAEALFDFVDFYLLAGQFKANKNQKIKDIIVNEIDDLDESSRYKLLIYSINANPEFTIQK